MEGSRSQQPQLRGHRRLDQGWGSGVLSPSSGKNVGNSGTPQVPWSLLLRVCGGCRAGGRAIAGCAADALSMARTISFESTSHLPAVCAHRMARVYRVCPRACAPFFCAVPQSSVPYPTAQETSIANSCQETSLFLHSST